MEDKKDDIQMNSATPDKKTLMAILAYIGPLVIVSYLMAKDEPFVKYHIKQGLVLVILEAAVWFLGHMVWGLGLILSFVNLALIILSILGIVNAVKGKEKELPLVGKFSSYFSF